jgi:hypothetical protein
LAVKVGQAVSYDVSLITTLLKPFDDVFHASDKDESSNDLLKGVFVYLGVLLGDLLHEMDEVLLATLTDDLRLTPENHLGLA